MQEEANHLSFITVVKTKQTAAGFDTAIGGGGSGGHCTAIFLPLSSILLVFGFAALQTPSTTNKPQQTNAATAYLAAIALRIIYLHAVHISNQPVAGANTHGQDQRKENLLVHHFRDHHVDANDCSSSSSRSASRSNRIHFLVYQPDMMMMMMMFMFMFISSCRSVWFTFQTADRLTKEAITRRDRQPTSASNSRKPVTSYLHQSWHEFR